MGWNNPIVVHLLEYMNIQFYQNEPFHLCLLHGEDDGVVLVDMSCLATRMAITDYLLTWEMIQVMYVLIDKDDNSECVDLPYMSDFCRDALVS